ncbi:MAG: hypothetical protein CYPHOPRED_003506 [Cyphobasidiales sp. Tagirdzhanova-0007]|nr:MAG: hypothetical protein CYPHOPRED_003506 [Cyphobasidiales sp. Tagirdzhanova-0007]
MLTPAQQSVACLTHIKTQLARDPDNAKLLQDPFFLANLDHHFVALFSIYTDLYGYRNDCLDSLVELIRTLALSWYERRPDLKQVDKDRLLKPSWYMSNNMLGGMCYVDLYAGNVRGIREKIPYFKELGLTYLHLMPLFKSVEQSINGGYAVSSYRDLDARIGTMKDLKLLAKELHDTGICLVLDLVLSHTSNEHEWAKKATAGHTEYSQYYCIFPDRTVPNEFERTTRTVSPNDHTGSFVQMPDGRWVWSTFHHYQWDLNYSNPAVFRAMAAEMLFLANVGVDIFRMDGASFVWASFPHEQHRQSRLNALPLQKRIGTTCENLPEAHKLIRAYNAICRISAPSILFQSELIPQPTEGLTYISSDECQLSYNPLEMALGWEALATRKAGMLQQALERWHNLVDPEKCHWVNYVRSHEDLTWPFSDEDAAELNIHGPGHRRFLNAFYVNRFQGSFARGVPFQDNPRAGDCRVSGTAASLAGLESGEEHAVERLLLLYSIAFSTGGIALLYLGDEVGQLNDYSMLVHPEKANDTRWVHRPAYPSQAYEDRNNRSTMAGKMFKGLKQLISLRKGTDELSGGRLMGFHTDNAHILGYQRIGARSKLLILCNFHDEPQRIGREKFAAMPPSAFDLVSGYEIEIKSGGLQLRPHQFVWLRY